MRTDTADPELLQAALSLAARGWHVFPLLPGDKRPAIKDWENRATTDSRRIRRCWSSGPYGIGVACGPSNLVVVDLDVPKNGQNPPTEWAIPGIRSGEDVLAHLAERADASFAELLDTYSVRTGSGGLHLYFQAPSTELRNTAGQLGWLIDTRAHGGYVVGPGSVVQQRKYVVLSQQPPTSLPQWIAKQLTPKPLSGPNATMEILRRGADQRSRYANAALRAEMQRVLDAREGSRNDTLVRAAFALGQLVSADVLPILVVEEALMAAGQAIGLTARECAATIRSGMGSGMIKPRGGAA